jgi:hypothetical protein
MEATPDMPFPTLMAAFKAKFVSRNNTTRVHTQLAAFMAMPINPGEKLERFYGRVRTAAADLRAVGGLASDATCCLVLQTGISNTGYAPLDTLSFTISSHPKPFAEWQQEMEKWDDNVWGKNWAKYVGAYPGVSALQEEVTIKKRGRDKGPRPTCPHCKKIGHTEVLCWIAHPELKAPALIKIKEHREKVKKARKEAEIPPPLVDTEDEAKARKNAVKFHMPSVKVLLSGDELEQTALTMHGYGLDLKDWIMLDTGASDLLFILSTKDRFDAYVVRESFVGTASTGGPPLIIRGVGTIRAHENIMFCPDIHAAIISLGRVITMGLILITYQSAPELRDTGTFRPLVVGKYIRGRPWFPLEQILKFTPGTGTGYRLLLLQPPPPDIQGAGLLPPLPEDIKESEDADQPHRIDRLELLHRRTMHHGHTNLIDAYKHQLFRGYRLERFHLGTKLSHAECHCEACATSRTHRLAFRHKDFVMRGLTQQGDCVVCDESMFVNCKSRLGETSVINFTDVASKETFSYFMSAGRTAVDALTAYHTQILMPRNIKLLQFHSDGAPQFIAGAFAVYIKDILKARQTHSLADTPELNGLAEAINKILKSMTLAAMLQASADPIFWGDAYLRFCTQSISPICPRTSETTST